MTTDNVFMPLDNFSKVSFSNAYTIKNGQSLSMSQAGAQPITMITNSRRLLAATTNIGADGSSFTVNQSASADTIPVSSNVPNQIQTIPGTSTPSVIVITLTPQGIVVQRQVTSYRQMVSRHYHVTYSR